jgi:glycine C-acetyltransferase
VNSGVAGAPDQFSIHRGALPRDQTLKRKRTLRAELAAHGYHCLGQASAINPVPIGSETVARTAMTLLPHRGLLANFAEFPAVPRGSARFRLQAMATHTIEQARYAARTVAATIDEARLLTGEDLPLRRSVTVTPRATAPVAAVGL